MRRVVLASRSQRSLWCFAPLCLGLVSGCGSRESEIKTYRIAKEDHAAPKVPGHFPGDGHDHEHGPGDGHDHGPGDAHHGGQSAAATPKLAWSLPTGWKEMPAEGMRKAEFQVPGSDGKMARVLIIPLVGVSNIELQSVNLWREELGLGPLTSDQLSAQAQPVSVGDSKGQLIDIASAEPPKGQPFKIRTVGAIAERENIHWFVKMTGEDDLVASQKQAFVDFLKSITFEKVPPSELAASEVPASTNTKKLPSDADAPDWKVPAHWQEKPPGPMVTTAYGVTGSEGEALVTVIKLPGTAGGLVGNVNRWRGQVGLKPLPDAEVRNSIEPLEIDGKKDAYLVDLKGTDAKTGKATRMLAAGVPRGGETYFYKMLGDDPLVAKEKDTFLKFIVSAY